MQQEIGRYQMPRTLSLVCTKAWQLRILLCGEGYEEDIEGKRSASGLLNDERERFT
jgi:hypothetical protein